MKKDKEEIFNEAQLILAEKRTIHSFLRTGIAILALPLSSLSFLVAFSKNYNLFDSPFLVIFLFAIILFLTVLAVYIIIRSLIKLHFIDRRLKKLSEKYKNISKIIPE
ncbi:MAG: hypothetical protein N2490_06415 [Ignavibacteria bacterium]|nr:hypothetical protein [Ignavibacteria bacterium]